MSNQLSVIGETWWADQSKIDLLKRTVCDGASNDEFAMFMAICQRTRLDPFMRQIYMIERSQNKDGKWVKKMEVQTSIDGFRLTAERTGKYEGQTPALWCGMDGEWVDVWVYNEPPIAAKIGVHKTGFREPLFAVARFDSYAGLTKDGNLTKMWSKMGDLMIAKCAEALALRKAFPNDLSGLYTSDEMSQATNDEPEKKPYKNVTNQGYIEDTRDHHEPVAETRTTTQKEPANYDKDKTGKSDAEVAHNSVVISHVKLTEGEYTKGANKGKKWKGWIIDFSRNKEIVVSTGTFSDKLGPQCEGAFNGNPGFQYDIVVKPGKKEGMWELLKIEEADQIPDLGGEAK